MTEPARKITEIASATTYSALDLRMMTHGELIELYHQLDAPKLDEMHGEFAAMVLDEDSTRAHLLGLFFMNMSGRWLCKAFEPTGPNEGHGYNSIQVGRQVRRGRRMKTRVGPSKLPGDTKDAFHLEYADFNSLRKGGLVGATFHTMFDEIRKAGPGVYLGIGRVGFTRRGRAKLHPFMLEGPVGAFVRREVD